MLDARVRLTRWQTGGFVSIKGILTAITVVAGLTVVFPYTTQAHVGQQGQPPWTMSGSIQTSGIRLISEDTAARSAPAPSASLPATSSALPIIGLAAVVAIALGLAVRFGV